MNKKKESLRIQLYKNKYRLMLIAPAVILVFIFNYLPFLGISIAFQDFDIIKGFSGSEWVGFQNFIDIFATRNVWEVVVRTLEYSIVLLFLGFPFPIILALLLNELKGKKFKRVAQSITYLPHFLSMTTVVGLFYGLLQINGPINSILATILGEAYEKKNILLNHHYFLPIIFSASLWKETGWSSVIYLAAIAGIDTELYEAAAIDGCNKFKQIFFITIPGIAETILILFIMNFGGIFGVGFELVYGFQNLYTQPYTDVISTMIYRNGLVNGNYSAATAFGLTQGLVSLVLVYCANKVIKKLFNASIWG